MTRAKGPLFDVHFRRRRQGRTNYAKRLALLKSGALRLVVRKLNRQVLAQVVKYSANGDETLCQSSSKELQVFGFNGKCNVPSAYLVGFLLGRKALVVLAGVNAGAASQQRIIADFGLHSASKGGVLFAVVKGCLDSGLKVNIGSGAEMFPSKERIAGKHIGIDISQALENIKTSEVKVKPHGEAKALQKKG